MRSITFNIGNVQVTLTEQPDGSILFQLDALKPNMNILGLFFDLGDDSLFGEGLHFSGPAITNTVIANEGVTSVAKGVNMNGTGADPFDVGVAFGTGASARSPANWVTSTQFTLAAADKPLTLDAFAHVNFGINVSGGGQAKAVLVSPAAPDAVNDSFSVDEKGIATLSVLGNDTDADGSALVITSATGAAHGTVEIAADGHTIKYAPNGHYSGTESFSYTISDGHGGQDTANVTIQVIPVADTPTLDVQVQAGDAVNEIKLHISTAVTDTDGSEFIDRLVFSGLPDGTQINEAPGGVFDLAGSPTSLDRYFTLVLPEGGDYEFDLVINSYSHESGNGDEASSAVVVPVSYESSTQAFNKTFLADNQNIWGTGGAFSFAFAQFLGIDQQIHEGFDFPADWGDPLLYGEILATFKAGLDADIFLTAGEIDAQVPMDITFAMDFNRTTDVLVIDPSAVVAAGVAFESLGPQGHARIDAVFRYDVQVSATVDLPDLSFGLNLANPKPIPFMLINESENYTRNLLDLDSADLHFTQPLPLGISGTVTWPYVDATGTQSGSVISSSAESQNFLQFDIDVDQALADIFLGGVNPMELDNFIFDLGTLPVPWSEDPIQLGAGLINAVLIDLDASAGLNFIQDLNLAMSGGLTGVITFENGEILQFNSSDGPITLTNASHYDSIAGGGDGNGQVEFSVTLQPVSTLENDTDIGVNVGLSIEALQASLGASENTIFGLALATLDHHLEDPLNIGPLIDFDPEFQVATIPVFDADPFAFNFQTQTVDLFVVA